MTFEVADERNNAGRRTHIPSPCVSICRLDTDGRNCLGCGRTVDEIAHWAQLDDATRADIMSGLAARIRKLHQPRT
jgi:predicted Fe-S protein YdhL (DUF1289 family)